MDAFAATYERVAPFANEEGVAAFTETRSAKEQAVEEQSKRVTSCAAAVYTVQQRFKEIQTRLIAREKVWREAQTVGVDRFVLADAPDQEAFAADFVAQKQSLELDRLICSRLASCTIPRASLDEQAARVAELDALADEASATADLLVCRKLLLLKPVAEQEGSSMSIMGGASDAAIAEALTAREKAIKALQLLEEQESLFAQALDRFLTTK